MNLRYLVYAYLVPIVLEAQAVIIIENRVMSANEDKDQVQLNSAASTEPRERKKQRYGEESNNAKPVTAYRSSCLTRKPLLI